MSSKQFGFDKIFDNLILQRMNAMRKMIQSLVNYVIKYCFGTHVAIGKSWQ